MAFTLQLELAGQVEEIVIDGELVESLSFFEGNVTPRIFSCAARLDFFDLAEITALGLTLDTAYARIYRGDDLVLAGRVDDPRWSAVAFTRFRVIEEPWVESVSWPPSYDFRYQQDDPERAAEIAAVYPPAILLGNTVTATTERVQGYVYPVVFGSPGKPSADVTVYEGSPALPITTTSGAEVLLACMGRAEASGCTVFGTDHDGNLQAKTASLSFTRDGEGREITVVNASGLFGDGTTTTDFERNFDNEFWIGWNGGSDDVPSPALSGGLGDVIEFVLNHTRVRIDRGRLDAYRTRLNQYRVDGYIDETVDLIEWLLDNLEPYPVRLVTGRDGVFAWLYDPEDEPVLTVTVGQNAHPDGDLRLTGEQPIQQYEIQYRHNDRTGNLTEIATVRTLHSELARQVGGRVDRVESNLIADQVTAELCSQLRVRGLGQRNIVVPLVALYGELGHLTVGDMVRLDYPREGLRQKRAILTRISDVGVQSSDTEELIAVELTVLTDRALWSGADAVAIEAEESGTTTEEIAGGGWGLWDPYTESASNFTAGLTNGWAQLTDQTGQGRDLTDTDDRSTPVTYDRPDATLAKYPAPNGPTAHAMPPPSGSQQPLYDESPGGNLESFVMVYAGPYDEAVSSTGSEYWLNQGSSSPSRLLSFRRSGGGTQRVVDWSGSAGPISGTAITIPGVGTGVDSWLAYAIRATDTGVGYDYRVIALGDMGDGAGVVLFGDVTTTDSTAHSSTTATRRTRWRGVGLESESLHGAMGLWIAAAGAPALSDELMVESLLALIGRIGATPQAAARLLL